MAGECPVIHFCPFDVWGKSFPVALLNWDRIYSKSGVVVFTAVDTEGQCWRFSNAISHELAVEIAPFKNQIVPSREFLLACSA